MKVIEPSDYARAIVKQINNYRVDVKKKPVAQKNKNKCATKSKGE